jgi:hypothetical protein
MAWLEQMRPSDGPLLVWDYPGEVVRIACRHDDRAGRRLVAATKRGQAPSFRPTVAI